MRTLKNLTFVSTLIAMLYSCQPEPITIVEVPGITDPGLVTTTATPTVDTGSDTNGSNTDSGTSSSTVADTSSSTTTVDGPKDDNPVVETGNQIEIDFDAVVVAEGEGTVEITSITQESNGILVRATITPADGWMIWDLQGGDLVADSYKLVHDVTGSFEVDTFFKDGDTNTVRVYFGQGLWLPTPGYPNSLEWFEDRTDGLAIRALDRAIEAGNDYMDEVIRTARILWFPYYQTLPNNQGAVRSANSAGGTSCLHDNSDHIIDMRHDASAAVVLHEAGHTVDNACSTTPEQHQRSFDLHAMYLQRAIDSGIDPAAHYQLGYGAGEWFACATAAYFGNTDAEDLRHGSGTITEGFRIPKDALRSKYPEMYELMEEIYGQ